MCFFFLKIIVVSYRIVCVERWVIALDNGN